MYYVGRNIYAECWWSGSISDYAQAPWTSSHFHDILLQYTVEHKDHHSLPLQTWCHYSQCMNRIIVTRVASKWRLEKEICTGSSPSCYLYSHVTFNARMWRLQDHAKRGGPPVIPIQGSLDSTLAICIETFQNWPRMAHCIGRMRRHPVERKERLASRSNIVYVVRRSRECRRFVGWSVSSYVVSLAH